MLKKIDFFKRSKKCRELEGDIVNRVRNAKAAGITIETPKATNKAPENTIKGVSMSRFAKDKLI